MTRRFLRIALAALLIIVLLAGTLLARQSGAAVAAWGQDLVRTLQGMGALGWVLFAMAQFLVAAFGVVPASLMGVMAGAVYGIVLGFALAGCATMAGAVLSFWLSRSVFRSVVQRVLARRGGLARVDAALAREGWRFVCLVRVNPAMPFAPTSFVLGLSGVSWHDYLAGTLAALPALLLYVALGGFADAGLAAWQGGAGAVQWVLMGAGALATVVLSLRLGWLATRAGLAPVRPD